MKRKKKNSNRGLEWVRMFKLFLFLFSYLNRLRFIMRVFQCQLSYRMAQNQTITQCLSWDDPNDAFPCILYAGRKECFPCMLSHDSRIRKLIHSKADEKLLKHAEKAFYSCSRKLFYLKDGKLSQSSIVHKTSYICWTWAYSGFIIFIIHHFNAIFFVFGIMEASV